MNSFLVMLGGGLGALSRVSLGAALSGEFGLWVILMINVLGSFAMGLAQGFFKGKSAYRLAIFFTTGYLGGFTTVSRFAVDSLKLLLQGQINIGLFYIFGNICLCLMGVALGFRLCRPVS